MSLVAYEISSRHGWEVFGPNSCGSQVVMKELWPAIHSVDCHGGLNGHRFGHVGFETGFYRHDGQMSDTQRPGNQPRNYVPTLRTYAEDQAGFKWESLGVLPWSQGAVLVEETMLAVETGDSRAVPILMTCNLVVPDRDGKPIAVNGRLKTEKDPAGEVQLWILKES